MPGELINCPDCRRSLRVPDNLLGEPVMCPTCGKTFTVQAVLDGAADRFEEEPDDQEPLSHRRSARRRTSRREEEDDRPSRGRRRRRRYLAPHRGTMILVLGVVALLGGLGLVLGPIAWIMGNADLQEIRAGRMDPEGESTTNLGRIFGMVATILTALSLVCVCGVYLMFGLAMFGAAAGSAR
jgi:hypothetical protein